MSLVSIFSFLDLPHVAFVLLLLLAVSFLTLLERVLLSLAQSRMGPYNVSIAGLLQPLFDAANLFLNSPGIHLPLFLLFISGMLGFFLSLIQWFIFPPTLFFLAQPFLWFLFLSSLMVFPTVLLGWFSQNNFSMFSALRGIALILSYEVCFSFFFLVSGWLAHQYMWEGISWIPTLMLNLLLFFPFFSLFLCECGRIPFDLFEAESELVSSYNTEYSSGAFTFLFLGEYTAIFFFCGVLSLLMDFSLLGSLFLPVSFFCLFSFIRGCLPRLKFFTVLSSIWFFFFPWSLALLNLFILSL